MLHRSLLTSWKQDKPVFILILLRKLAVSPSLAQSLFLSLWPHPTVKDVLFHDFSFSKQRQILTWQDKLGKNILEYSSQQKKVLIPKVKKYILHQEVIFTVGVTIRATSSAMVDPTHAMLSPWCISAAGPTSDLVFWKMQTDVRKQKESLHQISNSKTITVLTSWLCQLKRCCEDYTGQSTSMN